jgi:hypothetical protein
MGKNRAPAIKKPHIACEKQVKMCVSHAKKQAHPSTYPISAPILFLRTKRSAVPQTSAKHDLALRVTIP